MSTNNIGLVRAHPRTQCFLFEHENEATGASGHSYEKSKHVTGQMQNLKLTTCGF